MTRPAPLDRTVLAVALRSSALAAAVLSGCGDDGAPAGPTGGGGSPTSSSATVGTGASSSSGGGAGGSDVASCGPVTGWPPSEACTTCSWTHCCDEVAACGTNATCSGFASCVQTCGDDVPCIDACAVLNWGESPQDLDVLACQLEHCGVACGVAERRCDLVFAPPNAADRDACHDCLATTCCEENQAVFDPEVVAFGQCSLRCAEPACLRACELAHPRGVAALTALQTCIGGTCGSSCAPDDPGALCGGFVIGNVACASCARPACCEAYEACAFDMSCRGFLECWLGCFDDASCRACYETWPAETAARAVAMEGCASVACADPCSIPRCGLIKPLVPAACASCLEDACCDATGACLADPGCTARLICSDLCEGDAACEASCADVHPAGADLFSAAMACREASCAEVCP